MMKLFQDDALYEIERWCIQEGNQTKEGFNEFLEELRRKNLV
jgi:hypothetical protein